MSAPNSASSANVNSQNPIFSKNVKYSSALSGIITGLILWSLLTGKKDDEDYGAYMLGGAVVTCLLSPPIPMV